jgi:ectoine hydroxylase-related dioxygenase (phytanoyl-CoA dioxygenase family)
MDAFRDQGIIRLEKLIPDSIVKPARDLCYEELERQGLWRDGAWLADPQSDASLGSRMLKGLRQQTKHAEVYRALDTPAVVSAARELVGGSALRALTNRPQILSTPPNAQEWVVPHKVWHLDVPRLGELGLPGAQMFSFIDSVPPKAGGTLVAMGSHRLLNDRGRIRSKDVKRILRREEPWFRDLLRPASDDRERFFAETRSAGDVGLRVFELCGEPGDVFLMDLRMLHSLAPNASRKPRLMITQRYFIESLLGPIQETEADEPL